MNQTTEPRVLVPPTYPPGCKIVFCGEAAGPDEYLQKEGFVGRAGKLLDRITFAGGISRADFGVTNVAKRPPDCDCQHDIAEHDELFRCTKCECKYYNGFDSEHFKSTFYTKSREPIRVESLSKRCSVCNKTPKQHSSSKAICREFSPATITKFKAGKQITEPTAELLQYCELLKQELIDASPNIVVACGAEALKVLCGKASITNYRGSILPSTLVPGLKVVPMIHPAWILRQQAWQEVYISSRVIRDKVVAQSEYKELIYTTWAEIINPTIEAVESWIKSVSDNSYWVIDIETRQAGYIACVGLASNICGIDSAICIPVKLMSGDYFTADEELRFWQALQSLADRNPYLVMQNGFFDLAWLKDHSFRPAGVHDMMLLFHRMYPELPKRLAFTNMLYTDIPYYKSEGKDLDKTHGRQVKDYDLWKYNVKDCISELRVWHALLDEGGKQREQSIYIKLTQQIMPIAFEMQCRGLDVDVAGLSLAKQTLLEEYGKVMRKLAELSNGNLVALPKNKKISDAQVKSYLYNELKLTPKINKVNGNETSDEEAIVELLIENPELEVLKAILAERHLFKAISSYIDIEYDKSSSAPVTLSWKPQSNFLAKQ